MSKAIANLINQPEDLVSKAVKELEQLNGHPSHDVKLLAENHHNLRKKLAQMNLDPDDTTAHELYHCLLAKFEHDSKHLDQTLGLTADSSPSDRADAAIELTKHVADIPEVWALKRSTIRQLLKNSPPSRTMKLMHFRSTDSMLRRQNLAQVFLAAYYIEPKSWQKKISKQVAATGPADYERRQVNIISLPQELCQKYRPEHFVNSNLAAATIAVWPEQESGKIPTVSIVLLILAELEKLGAGFELNLVRRFNPVFRWWADASYLIKLSSPKPVSLNLLDVALNHLHGLSFKEAEITQGARQFWNELNRRYELQPAVESEPIPQYSIAKPGFEINLPDNRLANEYVEI